MTNRTAIMLRAWSIFRTYGQYPRYSFKDAGGHRMLSFALKQAWAEVREAEAIAQGGRDARIVLLRRELAIVQHIDNYREVVARTASINAELTALSNGADRPSITALAA